MRSCFHVTARPPDADIPNPSRGDRDGDDVSRALDAARHARRRVLHEIAASLQGPLNEYLRHQPQQTYEEKKALSKWLNQTLRELDLAIECPQTRMPAILVGNQSEDPARGRFQLKVSMPDGRRTKTCSMTALSELHFTPRDAGVDKHTLWQDRTGSSKGKSTRSR